MNIRLILHFSCSCAWCFWRFPSSEKGPVSSFENVFSLKCFLRFTHLTRKNSICSHRWSNNVKKSSRQKAHCTLKQTKGRKCTKGVLCVCASLQQSTFPKQWFRWFVFKQSFFGRINKQRRKVNRTEYIFLSSVGWAGEKKKMQPRRLIAFFVHSGNPSAAWNVDQSRENENRLYRCQFLHTWMRIGSISAALSCLVASLPEKNLRGRSAGSFPEQRLVRSSLGYARHF